MTTTQVHIKITCNFCNGAAFIPVGMLEDGEDGIYTRYLPCNYCQGTGLLPKWVSMTEFIKLIDSTDVMQPDYQSLANEIPTSQYQDSRDSAGI